MLPVVPEHYPSFWRAPGIRAWRPILAIILGAVGFLASTTVVIVLALFLESFITGTDAVDLGQTLAGGGITPILFLANSASLALLVPLSFLLSRLVGQTGGWISSVVGRVRWGWLMRCFVISLVAVGALIVVSVLLGWESLELVAQPGWWWLLIGIIVITPFQAAGEEYLIRGVLFRGVASLIPARVVGAVTGAVVSSAVFMLLHGAGDLWLNITYFSMGLLFSYLTWRTGGLEAAVAMHAANNLVAMMILPFQDLSDVFNRAEGVGDWTVLLQLVVLGAAAAVIVAMARRYSITRTGAPGALAASTP